MYLARSGSPGSRTASAYCPGSARTWIGMGAHPIGGFVRDPVRADTRAGARILRRGPGGTRLPRGRRAPQPRPVLRDRGRRGLAHRALPRGREPRAVGLGLRCVRGRGGAVAVAHDHRRGGRGRRGLGYRPAPAPRRARGPPAPAGLHDRRAAAAREDRAAGGDAARPAAAGPRVRRRPRARARDRSAAARPRQLSLAHLRADRRGPLVAVARERRRPLQGGGVRLDAAGGAAAAGLDRPGGARPRVRVARAPGPLPPAPREDAHGDALRAQRERGGDQALRADRDAEGARVPERALLRRLLALAAGAFVGRWLAREAAAHWANRLASRRRGVL